VSVRLALDELISATDGLLVLPPGLSPPEVITGVTTDSRTAAPGDLFVALGGPRADGHQFVADAVERGAVLAVVSDPAAARGPALVVPDTLRALGAVAALHRRTLETTVIGIAGSVGKTTTVGLCATVLSARYSTVRSAESWNAEIGVALTLLGLRPAHQAAVIEMAMRGLGQMRELVEIARPHIGAVTNIGDTHLEFLGSRENVAAAKAELLDGLPADGVAIVNADEALTARLVRDVRCPIVTFGLSVEAAVRATEITRADGGFRFILHFDGLQGRVYLPLAGSHQVRNALVAAAVGRAMGLGLPEIASGLSRVHAAKMRQEILMIGGILVIDDSYNASPQSMAAAFEVLAQVGGHRRRVLALGEMRELGPRSPDFHRRVGQQAAELSPAFLLAVGPNGRLYLDGAAAAGLPAAAMAYAETADAAVPVLQRSLRPGDVVLIKGSRTIEMERVVQSLRQGTPVSHP
jgi:UDP-N-acetylmuramoyl-tripeptide--D-alanyl-D-alanine ligase